MRRLRHKLNSRRGETLTESLCAMVVIGLSSVMLATMITAATHLNQNAITEDGKRADERNIAALQPASPAAETSTITVAHEDGSDDGALTVALYRKEEGALMSFSYPVSSAPPEAEAGEPIP